MILDKSEKYIIQFDKNNELQALAFAESLGVMCNSMNKPTDWLPSSSKLFSNGNLYLLIEWSDVYIPLPPPEFSIGTQGHYGYSGYRPAGWFLTVTGDAITYKYYIRLDINKLTREEKLNRII
jgi:hypothetical protein